MIMIKWMLIARRLIARRLIGLTPIALTPIAALLIAASEVGRADAAQAQVFRFPTEDEVHELMEEARQEILRLREMGMYVDLRTPAEREAATAFSAAWAEVDPAIAPFLGDWSAWDEGKAIYPSPNPGVVCIVDIYPEEYSFSMGFVVNHKIYTTTYSTLVLDNEFLVSLFVSDDDQQPGQYPYISPRPLEHPATLGYIAQLAPEVIEQFDQAGCITDEPLSPTARQ
ncbi:MAG: hypothetical protein WBA57_01645 [Elainellaceae cyanobacterium]